MIKLITAAQGGNHEEDEIQGQIRPHSRLTNLLGHKELRRFDDRNRFASDGIVTMFVGSGKRTTLQPLMKSYVDIEKGLYARVVLSAGIATLAGIEVFGGLFAKGLICISKTNIALHTCLRIVS